MKLFLLGLFFVQSCASYHFGNGGRVLPGGYDRVAVPMFVNKTQEVGIETYFTKELRTQFERSRLAKITDLNDAQMILVGTVKNLVMTPSIQITSTSTSLIAPPSSVPVGGTNPLPATSVLNIQYLVTVDVHLEAHKASDNSVLWQSDFTSKRQYQAPLLASQTTTVGSVTTFGPNTSAPLYNQNSRQDTIAALAKDMMAEAHDRLTENF